MGYIFAGVLGFILFIIYAVSYTHLDVYKRQILNYVLDKSSKVRQDICYNICFMDIPDKSVEKNYCWHARIIPRIGSLAGFEMGTAGYINPVLPEEATEYIKNLD